LSTHSPRARTPCPGRATRSFELRASEDDYEEEERYRLLQFWEMAAGGVGPAQHQAANGASGSVSNGGAATPLHGSAASTANGAAADGYDSDGYSFAPP
jgi:hypothetical protein